MFVLNDSKHTINKNDVIYLNGIYTTCIVTISQINIETILFTETAEFHEQSDQQSPRYYKL
jgi:hypothetical protein